MTKTSVETWMPRDEFLKHADMNIKKLYKLIYIHGWLKKGIIRKKGNEIKDVYLEKYNKWLEER